MLSYWKKNIRFHWPVFQPNSPFPLATLVVNSSTTMNNRRPIAPMKGFIAQVHASGGTVAVTCLQNNAPVTTSIQMSAVTSSFDNIIRSPTNASLSSCGGEWIIGRCRSRLSNAAHCQCRRHRRCYCCCSLCCCRICFCSCSRWRNRVFALPVRRRAWSRILIVWRWPILGWERELEERERERERKRDRVNSCWCCLCCINRLRPSQESTELITHGIRRMAYICMN